MSIAGGQRPSRKMDPPKDIWRTFITGLSHTPLIFALTMGIAIAYGDTPSAETRCRWIEKNTSNRPTSFRTLRKRMQQSVSTQELLDAVRRKS